MRIISYVMKIDDHGITNRVTVLEATRESRTGETSYFLFAVQAFVTVRKPKLRSYLWKQKAY